MNKDEFIMIKQEIFNILNDKSNSNFKIPENMRRMQLFMKDNPQDLLVQDFTNELINLYYTLFNNEKLINAHNLPELIHYKKQLEIYLNLPYTLKPIYALYLPYILVVPPEVFGNYYHTFMYVIKKYKPELLSNGYLEKTTNFVDNNKVLMNVTKDEYYSLKKEIELLNMAKCSLNFSELEEFTSSLQICKQITNEYARNLFINKRVGNIGELYVYESLKQYNPIFVAHDIGNGFGYDIYVLHETQEYLIEVKTTLSQENDYFSLSDNEFAVKEECSKNNNAHYIIGRVKLDSSLNPQINYLTSTDDITLDSVNQSIQYKLQSGNNVPYFKEFKR